MDEATECRRGRRDVSRPREFVHDEWVVDDVEVWKAILKMSHGAIVGVCRGERGRFQRVLADLLVWI